MSKPSVFISYSHKDEIWKDRLLPHLKSLEQQGDIILWDDRKIGTGDDWYPEIQDALLRSSVAICLITANYLSSDFINKEEIPAFKEKRGNEGLLLVPILVRPCPWKKIRWLKSIQIFPADDISIEEIRPKIKQERALSKIAEYVYDKINESKFKEVKTAKPIQCLPEQIDIDRLPQTGSELFGREKELKQLDDAWESTAKNIISFIAWGGAGKSTLINKWLEYIKTDNYKDAERVFAWSFYSQGTNEQVSSADPFIAEALNWFGDPDPTSGSVWDKGQRLAGLIRQKKTLLVLDGMEPLQSSHEFEKGKIKDHGLAALLRSLALNNNGLCIITSRENVADISKYKRKVEQVNLEKLSTNAGRALLRVGGVKGTDKELESAVEAFGNHALAIKLLPVYLRSIKDHHISDALKIPDLDIPPEKGKHPRRVIEEMFQRFVDKPEGDLLKMLGFFDRPADIEAIKKIMEPPVIEGLTGNICDAGETGLLQASITLRNETLLAKESKHRPATLDCHPLIREHFGDKLEKQQPEAWKEAHARLYEYYKNKPEKEYPDTLEEMEPLFVAVMHGCLAGKHQEALNNVYWKRIRRENEQYIYHKLGAFSSDLSCLSGFFETLWDKPASDLTEHDKASTLSWAGFDLHSLGRLSEAAQPMEVGLKMRIKNKLWKNAAIASSNLSELYLTLGDVASAQKYVEQSVTFADRCGDGFEMESDRTAHANALHQAGKRKAAEDLFIEAEEMQKKRQPQYPYLYSLRGFQFCDLLLSIGKDQEALERARKTLKWAYENNAPILDFCFNKLIIGKALLLQTVDNDSSSFTETEDYLNHAIDGLRESGYQYNVPLGLFARATLYRHQHDFLRSWTDLDEAREISEYGQMKLNLTDYHLEACRLINDQLSMSNMSCEVNVARMNNGQVIENGETLILTREELQAKFQEHFKEAARLIEETGYHRRDGELEELRMTARAPASGNSFD